MGTTTIESLCIMNKDLGLPAPAQCQEIIENANIFMYHKKYIM